MKVLFVEGKNMDALRELARRFPHPYRLLHRPQQEIYLLEAWAVAPAMEAEAARLEGFRVWAFELVEAGGADPAAPL